MNGTTWIQLNENRMQSREWSIVYHKSIIPIFFSCESKMTMLLKSTNSTRIVLSGYTWSRSINLNSLTS